MSDRQVLAEFGTALCLAGLAPWAAPLIVPVAVLGAFLVDLRSKCDRRLARTATDATLTALEDSRDLTNTDIRTARLWLDYRRSDLRLDPVALAKAALTGNLPDALYDLIVDDMLARDGGARHAVRLALTAAYQTCRTHDDFHKLFSQEVLIGLAQTHGQILRKLDTMEATLLAEMAKMQAQMLERLQSAQPQTYAAHTTMIIGLAERYARNPDGTAISDFDAAYAGLENALQVAETLRAQNALPRNATDQVDAVLARVQALNDAAEFDRADAALAAARAEARQRIAEQTSGLMRLLDSAVAQATLRNRPEDAAAALVERLTLDTPADPFAALRDLQEDWYKRGRDKGLAFDLEVSIELAKAALTQALTSDQRGAALNDLGKALLALGEREIGTVRLHEAINVLQNALSEYPRTRAPLEWAIVQQNLGNVFQALGQYKGDRPEQINWLKKAGSAYRSALEERTSERVPREWAMTQMNLANALQNLAQREGAFDRYPEVEHIYNEILEVRTRQTDPDGWAGIQRNLAVLLARWGASVPGTQQLEGAEVAFQAAIEVWTNGDFPDRWAAIQSSLANLNVTFFDKTKDRARLVSARRQAKAAREVFVALGNYNGIRNIDDVILYKINQRKAD